MSKNTVRKAMSWLAALGLAVMAQGCVVDLEESDEGAAADPSAEQAMYAPEGDLLSTCSFGWHCAHQKFYGCATWGQCWGRNGQCDLTCQPSVFVPK
ncbi:MAG: hypothetical protein KF718_05750 [Polyangiaceae bacterium]|nr:hypothetical protein [Polyangiaceae bacterium]